MSMEGISNKIRFVRPVLTAGSYNQDTIQGYPRRVRQAHLFFESADAAYVFQFFEAPS